MMIIDAQIAGAFVECSGNVFDRGRVMWIGFWLEGLNTLLNCQALQYQPISLYRSSPSSSVTPAAERILSLVAPS